MDSITWDDYRHPKFLQSLNLSVKDLKFLNLFLKKPNFRIDANLNLEHLQKTTLVSPKRSLNPSKLISQEKVGIKI